MSFTFCTSGAIIFKAGLNANAAAVASGGLLVQVADEAEAFINANARQDLVTKYSSLGTNIKKVLQDVASSYAAMKIISYDMSNYTSRNEAQTMLDVLDDTVNKGIALIKDDKFLTAVGAT